MSPSFGVRGRTEKKKIPTRSAGEKKETPLGQTMEKKIQINRQLLFFPPHPGRNGAAAAAAEAKGVQFWGWKKGGREIVS